MYEQAHINNIFDVPPFSAVVNHLVAIANGSMNDRLALLAEPLVPGQDVDVEAIKAGRQQVTIHIAHSTAVDQRMLSIIQQRLRRYAAVSLGDSGPLLCTPGLILTLHDAKNAKQVASNESDSSEAIETFDAICRAALQTEASDIHIVVESDRTSVLFRKHGALFLHESLTVRRAMDILNAAYNTLSDPSEREDTFNTREFQNCVIERNYPEGYLRLRFASTPKASGGRIDLDGATPVKVVLRLIKVDRTSSAKILSFEELGYSKDHAAMFRHMINKPVGVIIVAGETGSGKSTTLSNAIRGVIKDNSRNGVPEISVYTLEEPVETLVPGADQVPVSGKGAMAKAMRNVLRLDPDVIMVGEVRDQETAELMTTAVQSGHKVLTTVHASSALEVPSRLIGQQLRLPLDLIASPNFIAGLIFQRLLPVLCEHCKTPLRLDDLTHSGDLRERELYERLKRVGGHGGNTLFTRGAGCPRCGNTGYKGRTVCAEVILPDNTMLKHWAHGNLFEAIEHWRSTRKPDNPDGSQGRTALEHALTKMMAGNICPHDIERGFGNLDGDAEPVSAPTAENSLYENTPTASDMMKAS